MQIRKALSIVLAWLGAVVLATVAGAVVQTQFNLASIAALDVSIPLSTRLLTTLQDIVGFGILYGGLVALALALAFTLAGLLAGRWPERRVALFALAAAMAILVLIGSLNAVLPLTPIAATRNHAATVLMALVAAPAGLLYLRLRGWLTAC